MKTEIKKKICIVAPSYPYYEIRLQKEINSLIQSGYKVLLIARAEKYCEVKYKIIPAPFYQNRFERFIKLPLLLYILLKQKVDIFHFINPDTLIFAYIFKLLKKKVIYETHEDFTKKIFIKTWIPKIFRTFISLIVGKFEQQISKIVDASIATEVEVANRLGKKCILIENAPVVDNAILKKVSIVSKEIKRGNELRLIFHGTIAGCRGLYEMLDLLALINNEIYCRLWLIGWIETKELLLSSKHKGWKYVDFLGPRNYITTLAYVKKSDIGLYLLRDIGGHRYTSPNKLFEYLLLGVPFISSDFPLLIERLKEVNAGYFVKQSDIKDIVDKIIMLSKNKIIRNNMSMNGYKYISEKYNWNIESRKLINLYNNVISYHKFPI